MNHFPNLHPRRQLLLAAASAGLVSLLPRPGRAALPYPSKPIKLVVGIAAGSTTDLLARVAARHLSDALGQSVVIENRPGAGGTLGVSSVATAAADGHTLLFVSSSLPTFPYFYSGLRFDPLKSFVYAGGLAQGGMVMLTRPDAPWQNLADLIAYAKSRPAEAVSYASAGVGSIAYLYSELFGHLTGLQFLHVPYQSSAAALADLLSGQVDFVFDGTTTALPQVQSGRTRALAYSDSRRTPFLPQVPTMQEAGAPEFSQRTWFGLAAPASTDAAIIEKISRAAQAFTASPTYQKELADAAHEPLTMTAAPFQQLIENDTSMWGDVIAKIRRA
ncbi:tripartite tricarboxylate transporter substrate binding protein [Corticibacter populi]|uniref:Tripartite tricarboxylate transporter substrate binding protein n=1 Tax=Corticibacter populi TaxID=1550736 RepID=A0A3M6QZW2_9BURK|nr:tripartite tricarboxylate transporter substrate binding protein [Corticibacter populi]RMX08566.1 tripartite tricarboxylate transporter substrate binding protein [Corticibacter populi]RZS35888.1 tripartite-type tricarboxylate transporter receptor subunit TctC [Corticibacter populi]